MANITITLKQMNPMTTFSVEINENATILELKQKISLINTVPTDQQRLIYAGQILKDDGKTLSSYGIKDKFVIHFVKSNRPAPPSAASTPATQSSTTTTRSVPSSQTGPQNVTGLHSQANDSRRFSSDAMQSMLADPLVRSFVSNPEFSTTIRSMMNNNPQIRQLIDTNPQFAAALNNPEVIREIQESLSSPEAFTELTQRVDRSMQQISNVPELYQEFTTLYGSLMEAFRSRPTESEPPPPPNTNAEPVNDTRTDLFGTQQAATSMESLLQGFQGMGGMGGLGSNEEMMRMMNDPNIRRQAAEMMANPAMRQQMISMLSNPQIMESMAQINPQIRALMPLLRNPEVVERMFSPETLQMYEALGNGGMGGLGGLGGFGTNTNANTSSPQTQTHSQPQIPIPPQPLTQEQIQADRVRFAQQLITLRDMGFDDELECIRVLNLTNGSVQIAIERLLR